MIHIYDTEASTEPQTPEQMQARIEAERDFYKSMLDGAEAEIAALKQAMIGMIGR